ncbi:MAG: hypothetical protein WAL83_06380, partial [Arenicellales bacterium]
MAHKTSRRRALAGLVATVPAAWAAPIIKTVVLPAHAQLSSVGPPSGCVAEASSGSRVFTSDDTFCVPEGTTQVVVSAEGGPGGNGGSGT